jgi:hypothetical protein
MKKSAQCLALVALITAAAVIVSPAWALSCVPGTGSCPEQLTAATPDTFDLDTGQTFYVTFTVPNDSEVEILLSSTPSATFNIVSTLNELLTFTNDGIRSPADGFYSPGNWEVAFTLESDPMGSVALDIGNFGPATEFAAATPLPAALPLFAGGLGVMGLFARRKKRKNTTAIATS